MITRHVYDVSSRSDIRIRVDMDRIRVDMDRICVEIDWAGFWREKNLEQIKLIYRRPHKKLYTQLQLMYYVML